MISGILTQEQHLHALRLHRRKAVKVLVGVLLGCAVVGVAALAMGHHFPGLVLVGGSLCGVVGVFVQSRLALPRQIAKIHRQQASLHAHYTYSWDDEWLSVASEHVQAKRRWSDYTKMRESDELLLLYHSDIMFEVFPKAWFNEQTQLDEFRLLASRAAG
ncbi:YcxB family protein [Stenotrophomonas sp. 9(2022)]|uniref:YcxB family protein n=1 Tax=Stenotrophomonas sp. 9(2022) TaxID=2950153 RepID=UPI00211447DB|nr:YcxB family protein [Stenotrophomonas sp. 9(2022)]